MILPTPPAKGDSVLQWARNLTGYLRSLRPSSGPGIRIQHTPAGMAISSDPSRPTPAAATVRLPWQAYPVPYEGTGNPPPDQWKKFRVRPGMVNNIAPDNPNTTFTAPGLYSLEVNVTRGPRETRPLAFVSSINIVMGAVGKIEDDDGVPVKIGVALGYVGEDPIKKALIFEPYRINSFAFYGVETSFSCEDSRYYFVFTSG